MYIPGRSGAECEARWLNCEDPLINQNPWTSKEDKILLHVVQQKGLSNWIDIANSVGTNRTPFQCLSRYQRSLNASIIKREWTEEEDDQLRAAVEAFGESNWQIVASAMEGRTGTQCSNRWMKTLHPARQRVGRWTADEDKRLKVAVMLFGPKNWKKIAEFVPGRTQVQCRERWVNSLDPSLNLDTWTEEEDSKLKEAIEHHGYCWSKVAACIPPRTDSQCRRRWKVLLPHQVPLLRVAREMEKAALISNFVDRESERPALRSDDFVPSQELTCLSEREHVNLAGKQNRRFRHRRKDAHSNPCSEDLCSKEVPGSADGTVGETLTKKSASKNKRRKRHLKKTTSNSSVEAHPSCCQDLIEFVATKKSEELEISGAVNCYPERDGRDPETVSRDVSKSKGTDSVLGCNEQQSEKPGISSSHHVISGNRDDLVQKQIHETKSASKVHKSADDVEHQLSSSSTLKMYSRRRAGGSGTLRGSKKRGRILSEDAEDDGDLTLDAFYRKNLATGADTRDYDMTLASFCSNNLKKKRVKLANK